MMVTQKIELTLVSDDKELSCKHSFLKCEIDAVDGSNKFYLSKLHAEAMFGLVKDMLVSEFEDQEKEDKDGLQNDAMGKN